MKHGELNGLCLGPMPRRSFLQIGGVAAGGLGLSSLLKARDLSASAGKTQQDTSVIFVWLPGGAPHMETYDMKPDAPDTHRGEFNPIRTNVPGIEVCELLPMHAKCADKYNLIRSVHHTFSDHGGGHKRFLTGRDPKEPTGFINDFPCVGSMAFKALEGKRDTRGMPGYMALGNGRVNGINTFSFGSAYLGSETHPFAISADPSEKDFKVENIDIDKSLADRLTDRTSLLHDFDQMRRDVDNSGVFNSMDLFNRRALSMMTSENVRDAFDLSKESQRTRDRFSNHNWGTRALLARRLVEAGANWVTVVMENPYGETGVPWIDEGAYNWDSHAVNAHIFKDSKVRLPIYDKVITAMVEDLYERGLDRKVMLVVTGEFGRTPRISIGKGSKTKVDQPGRDHWPRAMSMLVSGGGMRTGQVIGATDSKGEEPVERPLSPNDLWASVYQHLGIDYNLAFPDHAGRPMPILPNGSPIQELLPVT
jgi:hypothetical protein